METPGSSSVKVQNIASERCRHEHHFTVAENQYINATISRITEQLMPILMAYHQRHQPGVQQLCLKDYSQELGRIIALTLSTNVEQAIRQEVVHARRNH